MFCWYRLYNLNGNIIWGCSYKSRFRDMYDFFEVYIKYIRFINYRILEINIVEGFGWGFYFNSIYNL